MNDNSTQNTVNTQADIIKFNIGGTHFSTYISTVTKKIAKPFSDEFYEPNLLERLVKNETAVKYDENNAIFIDRNPELFSHILDFLRLVDKYRLPQCQELINKIFEEAHFYQVNGLIELIIPFRDSTILNTKNAMDLINLCGFTVPDKWMLLYRGGTEEFNKKPFHKKFTGIPNTMIIAKSSGSSIYGCYTEKGWDSKSDNSSFLFSLISNEDVDFSFLNASKVEIYSRNIPHIIRV